MIPIKGIFTLM